MSPLMLITVHRRDADAEELDALVRGLLGELRALDVRDAQRPTDGEAPEGTRASAVASLATVLVSGALSVASIAAGAFGADLLLVASSAGACAPSPAPWSPPHCYTGSQTTSGRSGAPTIPTR